MEKTLQIVGLRVGRETLGLPISLVREIVRVPEITPVPNAPEHVEGVINLRGKVIAVLDLGKRIGEAPVERNSKSRIVVVELEERLAGLLVNSASEVLRIAPSEIVAPEIVFPNNDISYVTGVGKLRDRLIILLDLSRILQRAELQRLNEVAELAGVSAGTGTSRLR
ncbi:MAG TPA: chemotaxis protein CheW [Candidatus Acidoferrales bacterium]|nr:chemotaxis protein CheW [Candidatus Acidoferrales bacterium]